MCSPSPSVTVDRHRLNETCKKIKDTLQKIVGVCLTRHPHHHRSTRACHEFSTLVRWLSYVDIAWLVGSVKSSSSGIPEEHRSLRAYFSTCLLDTVAGWESIPHRSRRAYLATLSLGTVEDVMVGEVDELEEDVGWSISCLEGVMDVEEASLRKNSSINLEP